MGGPLYHLLIKNDKIIWGMREGVCVCVSVCVFLFLRDMVNVLTHTHTHAQIMFCVSHTPTHCRPDMTHFHTALPPSPPPPGPAIQSLPILAPLAIQTTFFSPCLFLSNKVWGKKCPFFLPPNHLNHHLLNAEG
jgi:hypothetical protein